MFFVNPLLAYLRGSKVEAHYLTFAVPSGGVKCVRRIGFRTLYMSAAGAKEGC